MTLDEQLRAALSQEADMQTVPRPDVDELISGGRVRRRRRNQGRIGVAAAVAVLLAGGAYAVTLIDPTTKAAPADTSKPSRSAGPQSLPIGGGSEIKPGTYRMLVGLGASGATLEADLTIDGAGWTDGNYPVVSDGATTSGVGVYRPQALAAGSGCDDDPASFEVAETSPAPAEQLSELPRSTVLQAAAPQRAFGRDTLHLRLLVNDQCATGTGYRVAETIRGSRGISYSDVSTDVVIDFWVVDVDGVPVVVDAWHQAVASNQQVDQMDRTRASVTFPTDQ
jgi:hypothetical protein